MNVTDLESPFKELTQAAVQAKNRAYCPYSNFHVGAAVLTATDQVVTDCHLTTDIPVYSAHGGCNRSVEDAYSSMAPDPTFAFVGGVNVENVSYGLCVCAERVAIMNAVTQGYTQFRAIAVCCDNKDSFECPCGACRQIFAEFGLEMDLYLVKPDCTYKKIKVAELCPMAFTPASLKKDRV